jgi:hypothetical protein
LPPLTYDEWSKRELGETDFISGSWLSTTSRALLIAPTGIGKTTFAMQLGYDISLGRVFLHRLARRQCRVLYIDGGMARRLLRKRVIECKERAGEVSTTFFALSHEDIENFKPLNTKEGQALGKDKWTCEGASVGKLEPITTTAKPFLARLTAFSLTATAMRRARLADGSPRAPTRGRRNAPSLGSSIRKPSQTARARCFRNTAGSWSASIALAAMETGRGR